jgi:hypothetical protein
MNCQLCCQCCMAQAVCMFSYSGLIFQAYRRETSACNQHPVEPTMIPMSLQPACVVTAFRCL